jgi:hypothetical protein
MTKEEPKQETLEEVALNIIPDKSTAGWIDSFGATERIGFIKGAKWQAERMYSEEEMINFAEFVATYTDKNRNVNGEMLHAKSKYDGAERTIDLLEKWFEQFKKK